jgi:CBS-domain-containing membrane protein
MKTAADIMTRKVITVTPATSVQELALLLTASNISGAPVLDETGRIIGIVTENDLIDQNKKVHIPTVLTILDSFIYLESPDKMEKEMKKMAGSTVMDICSRDIVTVAPECSLEELATIMAEQHIHTLPVVSNGKLVGIIGKKDIIKTIIS